MILITDIDNYVNMSWWGQSNINRIERVYYTEMWYIHCGQIYALATFFHWKLCNDSQFDLKIDL